MAFGDDLPTGLGNYNAFSTQPLVGSAGGGGFNWGNAGFGALSGLAGFFPTPSNTTTSGSSNISGTSSTTPNLSPIAQDFLQQLAGKYSDYINSTPDLNGYFGQQANQINQTSADAQKAINENLAARGLSTSPIAATATTQNTLNRTNQLNTLNQSLPLLARQLQGQALQQGNQFFSSIPYGQSAINNQTQNFNQTSKTQSGGGLGSALGGLASGLASGLSLFSDKTLKKDSKSMSGSESIKLLSKLKPVSFKWKENGEDGHGFMAQDVAKVLPKSVVKDDAGFHRLDMIQVIPHLVSAVNSLTKEKKAA